MKKVYKWGILGPGKIAHRLTDGLKLLDNSKIYAVGSRSIDRARSFAEKYGCEKYYGSYGELANDPDVDIIYVASPHSHHMEHTLLCLEGGKSVLCEKAFAINSHEVAKMIKLSRQKGLFLMEALWPPFQPSYIKAREILDSRKFGEIVSIRSCFAFKPPFEPEKRLYNKSLGGGALLDIGIYPVIDALSFIGVPDTIQTISSFASTGADDNIDILFGYNDGRSASLYASLKSESGIGTDLICEGGTISLRRESDGSQYTTAGKPGAKPEIHKYEPPSRGFHLEAKELMDCLDKGEIESSVVPLSFSIDLMETLDRIRKEAGIEYKDRD